jgi:hypothetical protein
MSRIIFCVVLLSLVSVGALGQNVTLPSLESEFCSIVENANSTYRILAREREVANDQQNGIRVQQIEQHMTSVFRTRNEDIFRLMQGAGFAAENWLVSVIKINAPMDDCHTNMPSCIFVDVRPLCSPITIIHANTPAAPTQLQFLAAKQRGDHLVMSGAFVERWGGPTSAASPVMPTSPEEFEGSFRESGSMGNPEYSVDVTQWR